MSAKPSAKSKTVILRLPADKLAAFPHESPTPASKASSSPDNDSTPAPAVLESTARTPADSTPAMNGNDTTTGTSLAPPAAPPGRKKPGPVPKKRAAADPDAPPKPRGKPGPKSKKQKMGDMINDPNNKTPFAVPAAIQKLGPKANMGAINANLRSLDRTGKIKARKWEKKGFTIRSFTGVSWHLPTYKAPPRQSAFSEDVKSETTGSSDTKLKDESSAVSDKSGNNSSDPTPVAFDASSPAPIAAAS